MLAHSTSTELSVPYMIKGLQQATGVRSFGRLPVASYQVNGAHAHAYRVSSPGSSDRRSIAYR